MIHVWTRCRERRKRQRWGEGFESSQKEMTDCFKRAIRIMLAWKDLTWEWFIRLLSRTIEARRWTIKDWVKIALNLDLYTLQKYCSRIGQSIYREQTKLRTFTTKRTIKKKISSMGFSGGSVVKNPPANAGDTGLIPDPGRSQMPPSN